MDRVWRKDKAYWFTTQLGAGLTNIHELIVVGVVVGSSSLFASAALPRRAADIVDSEGRHLGNDDRPHGSQSMSRSA